MRKVNVAELDELAWSSPKGRFGGFGKQISEALGRDPTSTDLRLRHPFDVELQRVTPGMSACPYHAHSAQWEFYYVLAGRGVARHADGRTPIAAGDAFLFPAGEPHQVINDGDEDLVMVCVADNPIGESFYYPDSEKIGVNTPERRLVRSAPLEYYDGEE